MHPKLFPLKNFEKCVPGVQSLNLYSSTRNFHLPSRDEHRSQATPRALTNHFRVVAREKGGSTAQAHSGLKIATGKRSPPCDLRKGHVQVNIQNLVTFTGDCEVYSDPCGQASDYGGPTRQSKPCKVSIRACRMLHLPQLLLAGEDQA